MRIEALGRIGELFPVGVRKPHRNAKCNTQISGILKVQPEIARAKRVYSGARPSRAVEGGRLARASERLASAGPAPFTPGPTSPTTDIARASLRGVNIVSVTRKFVLCFLKNCCPVFLSGYFVLLFVTSRFRVLFVVVIF